MKVHMFGSIRTNNFDDEAMMEKIGSVWESAAQQVEQPRTMYGVYFDYASNYRGDYSLGVAVEPIEGEVQMDGSTFELPDNVPYDIFRVDTADETGVVKTWQHIWSLEDAGTLRRAYTIDYEQYNPDGTIAIYIATKQ